MKIKRQSELEKLKIVLISAAQGNTTLKDTLDYINAKYIPRSEMFELLDIERELSRSQTLYGYALTSKGQAARVYKHITELQSLKQKYLN